MTARQPFVASAHVKHDVIVSVAFAGLAGIVLGLSVGTMAGVIAPLQAYFHLSDSRTELVVGLLNAMAFIGCFLAAPLADRYGRRSTLSIAGGLYFLGCMLQALSWEYAVLLIGRGFSGVAMGFTLNVAPTYVAEVAPERLRGTLMSLMEISINLGIVLGYFLTWLLQDMSQDLAWRFLMGAGALPAMTLLVGSCVLMVESPRWLAMQGKFPEAQIVLDKLMEQDEGQSVLDGLCAQCVSKDHLASSESPESQRSGSEFGSWRDLVCDPKVNRLVLVGSLVAFFSQATGTEAIQSYNVLILETVAGFPRDVTLLLSLWIGLVKLVTLLIAMYLVDRVGRRPLLMVSGIGMTLSMAVLSATAANPHTPLQVAGMISVVAFFSVGFGPLTCTINTEILPLAVRSKGMSVAMSVARVMSTLVSITFLSLADLLTYQGAWAVFAATALAGFIFVCFCLPETRGKSLEAVS